MPRPPRTKIRLTTDSIEQELQEIKNQAEELRIKASRDYQKVTALMETSEDIQVLENSRSNSLRALRDYLVLRKDVVNIQRAAKADQDKVNPTDGSTPDANGNSIGDGVIAVDWQQRMQQIRAEQLSKARNESV